MRKPVLVAIIAVICSVMAYAAVTPGSSSSRSTGVIVIPASMPSSTATTMGSQTVGVEATAASATAYAKPSYLPASADYVELTVNGVIVPIARGEGGSSNGITYDFARAATPAGATIVLRAREAISSYRIYPTGAPAAASVSAATLSFQIERPRYLIVQINNLRRLAILIDPPEISPDPADPLVRNIMSGGGIDNSGNTLNTSQIQSAIDALPTGGTLYFPAGEYKFTQIKLKSDMTLHLAAGAVLRGSTDPNDYEWFRLPNGSTDLGWGHVQMWDLTNVRITGHGIVDGRQTRYAVQKGAYRQPLLQIIRSGNVEIDGVTVMNAGIWNVTPRYSHDVTIRRLKVLGIDRWLWADGIDPASSRNVSISDSFVISGDDSLSPKGQDNYRSVINPKTENQLTNVTYRDMLVWSGRAQGIRVGTEVYDNVNNVTFTNVEIVDAGDRGIIVGVDNGDATIDTIRFENITIHDTTNAAIEIAGRDEDNTGSGGTIRNIEFENVRVVPINRQYRFVGFSSASQITGVTFRNLIVGNQLIGSQSQLDAANGSAGVTVSNVTGLQFVDTALNGPRFEAEAYNPAKSGTVDVRAGDGGSIVGDYAAGDALTFDSVDFGSGAESIRLRVGSASSLNVVFQVRLGGPTGRIIGTAGNTLKNGSWTSLKTVTIPIERQTDRKKLTLVSAGPGGIVLNWFELPVAP